MYIRYKSKIYKPLYPDGGQDSAATVANPYRKANGLTRCTVRRLTREKRDMLQITGHHNHITGRKGDIC